MLRAEGISKHYGGTVALDGVDFDVQPGEVHVLIGENGAGKSTLMKIIAGVETPSSGQLLVEGAPVAMHSVRDAARLGIGMVHQELNLCPNLNVAENIYLAKGAVLLDLDAEHAEAAKLLSRLGQAIDPARLVGSLSVGEQQIVEIAKALAEDCRILIFDEPTSALSEAEVTTLFAVIGELKAAGVGIVYISHRLEELLRVGDRITILRNGRVVAERVVAKASMGWMVEQMLGSEGKLERSGGSAAAGDVALALGELQFHTGEVTAIYGLLGSGRTELLETAIGARAGTVMLKGEDISAFSIADRTARGIQFVSEDRKAQGLFANLLVQGNITLANLTRFADRGVVNEARERNAVTAMIERLGVKAPSPEAPIGALSGGNQQKALIGRALLTEPSVLLLDEPSRGIDVGARAELFEQIRKLAAEGLAVVFSTSDLLEALAIADRVVVLSKGRMTLDSPAGDLNEAKLVAAANTALAA